MRATVLEQKRTGWQGDRLPQDLLPTSTVYAYVAQWRADGTWAKLVSRLRARVRVPEGRDPTPRAAGLDRHTVQTTEVGGPERGEEGGKNMNGRNRQGLVDTSGVRLVGLLTRAAWEEGAAALNLLPQISADEFPRLTGICGASK